MGIAASISTGLFYNEAFAVTLLPRAKETCVKDAVIAFLNSPSEAISGKTYSKTGERSDPGHQTITEWAFLTPEPIRTRQNHERVLVAFTSRGKPREEEPSQFFYGTMFVLIEKSDDDNFSCRLDPYLGANDFSRKKFELKNSLGQPVYSVTRYFSGGC